jgi:hypothetical protein
MKKEQNSALGKAMALAAVAAVFTASAADNIVFPNADSSGDFASLAAWNRAELPSTSNVLFSASGTYTATSDVEFNGFMPNANNISMTFDMSPEASGATAGSPRKIKVGARGVFVNDKTGWECNFTGGFWDFQNSGHISMYRSTWGTHSQTLSFQNVTITNLTDLKGGYGGSGHRITIGAGAKIYTTRCEFDGYQSAASLFEVKDGALLRVVTTLSGDTASFVIGRAGANAGGRNTLRVSGAGTQLFVDGSAHMTMPGGNVATGHLFHVTGGAQATIRNSSYKFIGGQASARLGVSSRWRIDDGGVLTTGGGTILLGHNGGFARIEVLEGGVWTNTAALSMGSEYECAGNNQFVVSNGTYCGKFPLIGFTSTVASNNLVQIMGPRASFNPTDAKDIIMFPKSHGNRFVLSDGAVWTNTAPAGNLYFSDQSRGCSNIFAVVRGATYYSTTNLCIAGANYDVRSNTLVVADSAYVYARSIYSSAIENGIILSNATIETSGRLLFSDTSYSSQMHGYSNCWMRVQGTRPRVKIGTSMTIKNTSFLHFDLPADEYDEGVVPITCGTKFSIEDKSRIYVNGVEEMAEAMRRPCDVVLLEAEEGITLANGVLAAANAHIAAQADKSVGSMLRLSDGNKQLVLHISYPNGTTIMIK